MLQHLNKGSWVMLLVAVTGGWRRYSIPYMLTANFSLSCRLVYSMIVCLSCLCLLGIVSATVFIPCLLSVIAESLLSILRWLLVKLIFGTEIVAFPKHRKIFFLLLDRLKELRLIPKYNFVQKKKNHGFVDWINLQIIYQNNVVIQDGWIITDLPHLTQKNKRIRSWFSIHCKWETQSWDILGTY